MAHPMKKSASEGHNAKLRRMTEDYGSASGAANNKLAPTNQYKAEGPEPAIGFGADSKPRGDRASRKQMVSNPVATLKRGGRVRHRDVGGTTPSESPIEAANVEQSLSSAKRANGGRTKKGATNVNVIVAPQSGNGAGGDGSVRPVPPVLPLGGNPAVPPAAGAMPPPRPPMMPPGMPPGGPGLPMGAPGAMPPGVMPPRARGGRVHSDEKQDVALIHKVLKDEGLERKEARSDGGRISRKSHHMTAGAVSGEGRLEKIGKKPHDAGRPQVV